MKIYDVFISYRRIGGFAIAEALYKYLTSKGLRVFFDKHEMIDGHYFTTQIETNLKIAPNYILVATDDVFKFRKKEDWVCKEIEVAIEEYESNPIERTLTVLVPESVTFPEKETLPQSVCNIADAQRITLPYGEDFTEPFYKALKAVTNINRRNLWFAAHRWLENSKQPGGRFASLNINESILPKASKNKTEQKAMPINVYSKDKENKNRQSLIDAMGCNGNHLYLIGQGGIGKTTALMHIMNNAYADKQYSEKAQIPLFIELSFAPDTYGALYEGGKSTFIRRSIYKQVRADRTIKQVTAKEVSDVDEVFSSLPYDVAVQPITDILSKTTPAPEYLLLLDGLNEVSSVTVEETGLSVVQMIMREIDLLISECPNVRVVLTSRSDESAIYNESISRLYLSGVEDSTIKDYLESFELSKEQIDKVLEDENLNETLQIPLFLTMYASLSKYDEVSTQGEILKLFFNERRKNISVYTMQERLSQVEKNITDVASAVQKNRIDADMQNFILDFILPEIAWFLERNGEFYLSVRSIRKIVEPILVDTDDLAFCGEFGREIFSKYRNGASAKMHTYKVAKKILERLGDDITEVTESIINCCVFALGVMQESNGKYGFVHQHIRDYFAALKNINTIRLSVYLYEEGEKELALECMNKAFKDEPVNYTVRRFTGEYLGEHLNKPYYANDKWNYGVPAEKCDRNLIKRALDIYRGYFNGEMGYGIYSIITILTEVRKDLSGSDLSHLDLRYVCFAFDTILGRKDCIADFNGTKIEDANFLLINHSEIFSKIALKPDGTEVATVIGKSVIVIWNLKLRKQLHVLKKHTKSVNSVCYSPDGKYFVSCSKDNTAIVWNAKTYEIVASLSSERFRFSTFFEDTGIQSAGFSYDSDQLFILDGDDKITVFDVDTFSPKKYINCYDIFWYDDDPATKKVYKELINVFFVDDEKMIGVVKSGKIVEWNIKNGNVTCEINTGVIECVSYSPQLNYLIYSIADKVFEFDLTNNKIVKEITHTEKIDSICFATEKHILVSSDHCNIFLYDINSGDCINKKRTGNIVALSNIERKKIAMCDSKSVGIYNVNSMLMEFSVSNYNKHGHCIAYSNDGKYFATPTSDAMIKIFDVKNRSCINQLQGHRKNVLHLQFSKNNKYIISISKDNVVKIWDTDNFECIATLQHDSSVCSVDIDNYGKFFLSSCNEKVILWNLESNICVKTFTGFGGEVNDAKFAFDFRYIIAASDKYIKIIDVMKRKILRTFSKTEEGPLCSSARAIQNFNNSERVAIRCNNDLILIINLKKLDFEYKIEPLENKNTLSKLTVLYSKFNYFSDLMDGTFDYSGFISSSDKYIAIASKTNKSILIFSAKDYKFISAINGLGNLPQFVKFSPDEKFLITSTVNSNYVSLWDIENHCMHRLKEHENNIVYAFFLNDGKTIISMSNDDVVKIHSMETFECIESFQLCDGYNVLNVNFKNIHTDSKLSDEKKYILKRYGAIID